MKQKTNIVTFVDTFIKKLSGEMVYYIPQSDQKEFIKNQRK